MCSATVNSGGTELKQTDAIRRSETQRIAVRLPSKTCCYKCRSTPVGLVFQVVVIIVTTVVVVVVCCCRSFHFCWTIAGSFGPESQLHETLWLNAMNQSVGAVLLAFFSRPLLSLLLVFLLPVIMPVLLLIAPGQQRKTLDRQNGRNGKLCCSLPLSLSPPGCLFGLSIDTNVECLSLVHPAAMVTAGWLASCPAGWLVLATTTTTNTATFCLFSFTFWPTKWNWSCCCNRNYSWEPAIAVEYATATALHMCLVYPLYYLDNMLTGDVCHSTAIHCTLFLWVFSILSSSSSSP